MRHKLASVPFLVPLSTLSFSKLKSSRETDISSGSSLKFSLDSTYRVRVRAGTVAYLTKLGKTPSVAFLA